MKNEKVKYEFYSFPEKGLTFSYMQLYYAFRVPLIFGPLCRASRLEVPSGVRYSGIMGVSVPSFPVALVQQRMTLRHKPFSL